MFMDFSPVTVVNEVCKAVKVCFSAAVLFQS